MPTNHNPKVVLIADDDEDIVSLLTTRIESLGLAVDTAGNAMTALGKIEQDEPDLVLLDINLPQGNGLSVCEMMSEHETLRHIPVVILTGSSDENTIRRCHKLCAYYVLKCTNVWARVEPLVHELLDLSATATATAEETTMFKSNQSGLPQNRQHEPNDLIDSVFAVLGAEEDGLSEDTADRDGVRIDQPWVLSIEDDDDVALALKLRLETYGVTLIRASEGTEGYRKAFFSSPRAILLDYELPEGNGDYVLRRLKETPTVRDIPVIVLTGRREAFIERQMRGLGAAEFLNKPFNWTELRAALDQHLGEEEPPPESGSSGSKKDTGLIVH